MKFAVVSLMPEMFDAIRDFGVTSRAFERNLVTLTVVNPRTLVDAGRANAPEVIMRSIRLASPGRRRRDHKNPGMAIKRRKTPT